MEIFLLPTGLIVGGYIITRLSRIDVSAIAQEWKVVLGMLILLVPLLVLSIAISMGTMTPDELNERTATIVRSATVPGRRPLDQHRHWSRGDTHCTVSHSCARPPDHERIRSIVGSTIGLDDSYGVTLLESRVLGVLRGYPQPKLKDGGFYR